MYKDIICPVCNKGGLYKNQEKCPQCDSDLTIFKDIEKLKIIYSKQERKNTYSLVLLVVLIFTIILLFYINIKLPDNHSNHDIVKIYSADTIIKSERMNDNYIEIKHKLRKGETLQAIVNFFDGKITVQNLMKENNITDPKRIRTGKEIKVKLIKE